MGAEIPDIKGRAVWRQGIKNKWFNPYMFQILISKITLGPDTNQDDTDIQSIEPVSSQTNLSTLIQSVLVKLIFKGGKNESKTCKVGIASSRF